MKLEIWIGEITFLRILNVSSLFKTCSHEYGDCHISEFSVCKGLSGIWKWTSCLLTLWPSGVTPAPGQRGVTTINQHCRGQGLCISQFWLTPQRQYESKRKKTCGSSRVLLTRNIWEVTEIQIILNNSFYRY